MTHIAILGEGAWGTAMALHCARQGMKVRLWCYHEQVMHDILSTGYNSRFLPHISLPPTIIPTTDLYQALADAKWIFEAIPVQYMRPVLEQVKRIGGKTAPWIVLSKGIEHTSLLVPTQLIDDVLGAHTAQAVLFGPTFAHEVARDIWSAAVLAAYSLQSATSLIAELKSTTFHFTPSTDVIGVQLCGAFKNVAALTMGFLEGKGYGENARAYFLTNWLQETAALVIACGGAQHTVYELAGIGDLMLTSFGNASKNRTVGKLLAIGKSFEQIHKETGHIPEGINTLKSLVHLLQEKKVKAPLFHATAQVLLYNAHVSNIFSV
jgi:glycerol-3-phosphate dehydrogenase (NAD(P)+)